MTGNMRSPDINFHIYLFRAKLFSITLQRHRFKRKDIVATKTYMTRKMYFHSLIHTQLKLSNLFTDCPLVKAWDLSLLGATVGDEAEKLVGRN